MDQQRRMSADTRPKLKLRKARNGTGGTWHIVDEQLQLSTGCGTRHAAAQAVKLYEAKVRQRERSAN